MFLSIFKVISFIFMAVGLAYFSYKILFGNSKLWYKLSVIFLEILALVSFIAHLYINDLFISLVSLSILGLLILSLYDGLEEELEDELEEEF